MESLFNAVVSFPLLSVAVALLAVFIAERITRLAKLSPVGKAVFITGCDHGFGHDLALRLAGLHYKVFAGCLTQDGAASLRAKNPNVLVVVVDVTQDDQVANALLFVEANLQANESLWAIVNNAGIAVGGLIEWNKMSSFKAVMDVNFFGLVSVTKLFFPLLRKSRGRVVNLTSVAGRVSAPGMSCYTASKHAAEAFSDTLRREGALFGVGVSIIEPGFFKTQMTDPVQAVKLGLKNWQETPDSIKEAYGSDYAQRYYADTSKILDRFANPRTELVVDALAHAVTAVRPLKRYSVGTDAIFYLTLSYLPSFIFDFLTSIRLPAVKK